MTIYNNPIIKNYIRLFPKGFVYFGHGVGNTIKDEYIQSLHLDFVVFKNMVEFYEQLGFDFISSEKLLEISKHQFKNKKPWLHISFDDGYENNYSVIYPFLKSKNIPFSIYISSNHIKKNERFYTYRIKCAVLYTKKSISFEEHSLSLPHSAALHDRKDFIKKLSAVFKTLGKQQVFDFMIKIDALIEPDEWKNINAIYETDAVMSKLQLQELSKDPLVSIGSHCHNHIILNKHITAAEIREEMERSRQWILENTGKEPCGFCYPNGTIYDFSRQTKAICSDTGYSLAFTTVDSFIDNRTDPLEIPRVFMFPNYKAVLKTMLRGKR